VPTIGASIDVKKRIYIGVPQKGNEGEGNEVKRHSGEKEQAAHGKVDEKYP